MREMPKQGFDFKQVRVTEVGGGQAVVQDRTGAIYNVNIAYRRGAALFPREGEQWIIDRTMGFWTFHAIVVPNPVKITGSTAGVPGLESLLTSLEEAGLIEDRTTQATESTFDYTWHPVTLAGAWVGGVTYRRIVGGQVLLRGAASMAVPATSVAFTLPVGYRPASTLRLLGVDTATNAGLGVQVATSGQVTLYGNTTLDPVCFLADG